MRPNLRYGARITVVCTLVVGGVMPFARAESIHTETTLAGFTIEGTASPILVLLDDPKAAVPRPTGTAVVEGDPNYTLAIVSTGPNARAVASTLWPGNLFGEGLSQINPNIPPYPIKAESRYPDKPFTAQGPDGGALTSSSALGLDAFAQADGTPTNKPGAVTVGNVSSTSTANVTDKDVAIATATSEVHDVNLLGGLIHIGGVTTRLVASSDGDAPASTGTTTVTGLTIANQSFSVDDKGLHAGPQNSALPELTSPADLEKALGISIKGIVQTTSKSANGATRTSSGLVIRVDTAKLLAALKPVIAGVKPIYNQLVASLIPADCQCQSHFYYLLNATPSLTFVFGQGAVRTAATKPIDFDFSSPPPPEFPIGGGANSGGLPPSSGGMPTTPDLGPSTGPGTTGAPPVLSPPGAPTPTALVSDARFAGISAGLLLGALIVSALIGWGLMRFLGLAGGVLGFGCRLGAPTSVPDLRSVTA